MANIIINTMMLLLVPFGLYGIYLLIGDKLDNIMKASRIHRVVNNFLK